MYKIILALMWVKAVIAFLIVFFFGFNKIEHNVELTSTDAAYTFRLDPVHEYFKIICHENGLALSVNLWHYRNNKELSFFFDHGSHNQRFFLNSDGTISPIMAKDFIICYETRGGLKMCLRDNLKNAS
jgi:hypothetical protein